ncbi:unnamed protein product [Phytophthora fragariaefolia]|uniref:Unnamed protein product n=1 Tax=Phytophthora fragariaefolia TaxID=1490495 RepID=A0A9W7CTQ4_9STRA|nr:unnamed protein product [Phytophthora fragariaefolia]
MSVVDDRSTLASEPEHLQSILPPLVLPGIQGIPQSGKTNLHHHKTPRKTPRFDQAIFVSDSSRTAPSSSSRLEKLTPRSPIEAELDLTPLSSARAAAQIYAQQPPLLRPHHHQHHKSKKLRDAASQTSPPLSPSLTTLPRQPLVGVHDDSHSGELPKTQTARLKHSPRGIPSPGNDVAMKADGGSSNTLLAPLVKTPAATPSTDASSTKELSPSRTHRNHAHGHQKGSTSPKRSGYCQRCLFEGRTCKINDCLKHQVLK